MARVKYTSGVESFRGRIGGTSFSVNRSGDFARARNSTPQKSSVNNLNCPPPLTYLYSLWSQLEPENQALWVALAAAHSWVDAWGITKKFTGQTLFVSMNYYRSLLSLSYYTSPPTYVAPITLDPIYIRWSEDILSLFFDGDIPSSAIKLVWYCSPPLSPSTLYFKNNLRVLGFLPYPSSSTLDVTSIWNSYFGFSFPPPVVSGKLLFNIGSLVAPLNPAFPIIGTGFSSSFLTT
jgi:hypothetical protein